jgi:hypothetical protein
MTTTTEEIYETAYKIMQANVGGMLQTKDVVPLLESLLKANTADTLERVREEERAYWIKIFDSAPVREEEHPHDIVARNFARIEIERWSKKLTPPPEPTEKTDILH